MTAVRSGQEAVKSSIRLDCSLCQLSRWSNIYISRKFKEVQGSSEATMIFQPQNSLSERVLVDGFCSILLRGVVIN